MGVARCDGRSVIPTRATANATIFEEHNINPSPPALDISTATQGNMSQFQLTEAHEMD